MSDFPGKRILSDEAATEKLDSGVRIAAETVGLTMGPKGWNVAIRIGKGSVGEGKLVNTKDGVFVMNHIKLEDPEEDMGAQMAVEASRKTNDAAGDGTTCTVVLLHAMLQEARKKVKVGSNPILIQQGMQIEKDTVVDFLKKFSMPVETPEDLFNVALVSCQDKDIAKKISDIIQEVGKFGTVGVETITGPMNIDLRVQRGMHFDVGFEPRLTQMSAASVMGQLQKKSAMNLSWGNDGVGTLIFDEPVRQWNDVAHIFSACIENDRKKLLIIGDFHDDAAVGLKTQMRGGIFEACTILRSHFGGDTGREILKDIAIFTGARFLSPSEGSMPTKNQKIGDIDAILGSCTADITMEAFSLTNGRGMQVEIASRIALIEQLMEQGGLNEYEKQKYRERIARFKAGIGTITISAPTEVQQQSIRTRVDDAVCAVRSANEEGIVAGGGVALLRCHQWLQMIPTGDTANPDIQAGREIVRDALLQPARTIAEVSGEDAGVRIAQLMRHDWQSKIGYDYWTEKECDLIKQGIIDPTKVVRLCMENAVSVVGELLRTRVTIVDLPSNEPEEPYLTPRDRALKAHPRRIAQQ